MFKTGKTYTTRSIGDHNCIISITVDSRTAKTIKAKINGENKTLRIKERDGFEFVMPWGNYSMAPIISCEKEGV
jgi:hypothetical protein